MNVQPDCAGRLFHLAKVVFRQFVNKFNFRYFVSGQAFFTKCDDILFRDALAAIFHDKSFRFFTVKRVRNTDHSRFKDSRDLLDNFFNLIRIDVIASVNNDILVASRDENKAIFIYIS